MIENMTFVFWANLCLSTKWNCVSLKIKYKKTIIKLLNTFWDPFNYVDILKVVQSPKKTSHKCLTNIGNTKNRVLELTAANIIADIEAVQAVVESN